jgi:hypothetical protein
MNKCSCPNCGGDTYLAFTHNIYVTHFLKNVSNKAKIYGRICVDCNRFYPDILNNSTKSV